MKPLNGEKTHPLSAATLRVLQELIIEPRPRQEVNPGMANRLLRGGLVRQEERESPYRTRKGSVIFLVPTDEGESARATRETQWKQR